MHLNWKSGRLNVLFIFDTFHDLCEYLNFRTESIDVADQCVLLIGTVTEIVRSITLLVTSYLF